MPSGKVTKQKEGRWKGGDDRVGGGNMSFRSANEAGYGRLHHPKKEKQTLYATDLSVWCSQATYQHDLGGQRKPMWTSKISD